jgi:hypothetical protein
VVIDDWYKQYLAGEITKHAGAEARLGDSGVLTIAIAGQWRVGVPWQSERGVVRWVQTHGRSLFKGMIGRSAFNARVRWLWGAFTWLEQIVGDLLAQAEAVCECMDGVPLPAMSNGQHLKEGGHGLWERVRLGTGAPTAAFSPGTNCC